MYVVSDQNLERGIKENKKFLIVLGILAFAMIFLTLDSILTNSFKLFKTEATVENIIPKTNGKYDVKYSYTIGKKNYTCTINNLKKEPASNTSKIRYNIFKPKKCGNSILGPGLFLTLIFFIPIDLGIAFLIKKVYFEIKPLLDKKEMLVRLQKTGTLIKNIPYSTVKSKIEIDKTQLEIPVVQYTTRNNQTLILQGIPCYDYNNLGKTIDLLIDENNPSDYYLGFEIRKIDLATNEPINNISNN